MKELSATELKRYLEEARQPPVLLDVREPWEFEIAHVAGSKLIPLSQLPRRLRELESDREIVVICHHGVRSYRAGLFLQSHGFQRTVNLRGGIDGWAREVDSSMPLYC